MELLNGGKNDCEDVGHLLYRVACGASSGSVDDELEVLVVVDVSSVDGVCRDCREGVEGLTRSGRVFGKEGALNLTENTWHV